MLAGLAALNRRVELGLIGQRIELKQWVFVAAAIVAMIVAAIPSYRRLEKFTYILFIISLGGLIVVFAFPAAGGAHRWIRLGPIGIQPSEFVKITYILAMARYLMRRENYRRFRGLLGPLLVTLVPMLMIVRQPDLGTALVFLPVLFVMLFVAGARRGDLLRVTLAGLACLPLLWHQMSAEQRSRVTGLFESSSPDEPPSDTAYHLYCAKRTRAMGGLWGTFWQETADEDRGDYHLPAAHNDFVYSVVGERFGVPGQLGVICLFALLCWRCGKAAESTEEPFGRLIASGVAALFAVEALINISMNVGLMPITGLSLPFVSSGGSGLVAHAIAIGLVMNIAARRGYEVAPRPFRWRETSP